MKKCEANMANITTNIRDAKTKKAEYGKLVVDCSAQIKELEGEIEQVHHSSETFEKQCSPESIREVPDMNKQLFEVELISDSEDIVSEYPDAVGKLCSAAKEDIAGKVEKRLSKAKSPFEMVSGDNTGSADASIMSVSEEVVIRSNNFECYPAISQKLDHILNEVIHNALPLPVIGDTMEPILKDSTFLSSECDVKPLVASVLSSLTHETYSSVTKHHRSKNGSSQLSPCGQKISNIHDCIENPFTVSTDDPPTLVLPMVVDGSLDLSISEPSLSSVAIEAVNDGIVQNASGTSLCLLTESADISVKQKEVTTIHIISSEDEGNSNSVGGSCVPVSSCQVHNAAEVCIMSGDVKQEVPMELVQDQTLVTMESFSKQMKSSGKGKSPLYQSSNDSLVSTSLGQGVDQNKNCPPIFNVSRAVSKEIPTSSTSTSQARNSQTSAMGKSTKSSNEKVPAKTKLGKNQPQTKSKTAVSVSAAPDKLKNKSVVDSEDIHSSNVLPMNGKCEGKSVSFKAKDLDRMNSAQIKVVLQKHLGEIDVVKKQLAMSKNKSNCARTSGLRSVTSSSHQSVSSETDESLKETEVLKRILMEFVKPIPNNLGNLKMAVSTTAPLQFSLHNLIFSDGIIKISPNQPDHINTDDFSLPTSTMSSKNASDCSFKPYTSPLLIFSSYRSSPNFSTSAKVPLDSLTYSNKIDPNRVFCQFELTGTCSDGSCTAQHFRDVPMTKDEIATELVSYCPSLAGCSEELCGNAEASGKLVSFSETFLKKYTGKVSDGDLWKILVYEVHKERMKSNSKKNLISFDCDVSQMPSDSVGKNFRPHLSILRKEDARK